MKCPMSSNRWVHLRKKEFKKSGPWKVKMTWSDCYTMAVCSSCSADVGGKWQHVIKEEGFDGSESLHDKLISLDLSQRAAGRKLILTDGVPKVYTHRSHGQMFLCVVGERMSEAFPGQPQSAIIRGCPGLSRCYLEYNSEWLLMLI